ncbi:hypothetical protein HOS13_gp46 [Caulobacter phage Lullwater]|uniref:Uncharacterized protein n=1 Tax=Caulobacter phage Lullwater TaxID=2024607 RepID=A0A291LB46_9CAUD|nr:hypothetical protein HOS13_gp46 [Caulobacter phage Lullwater]ATI16353.1 hypothetical protein Lull_046 [Caulobacter phage Lullwater]
MKVTDLPSPGIGVKGIELRRECANIIMKQTVIAGKYVGGKTDQAKALKAFFDACSSSLTAIANP